MRVPIVAIAASAGGLEALSELLAALPAECGLACIVIQHLDPGHESLLADILAKKTSLPVIQAHDGVVAEPDHVYVIPPNATLTLAGNRIHVTPRESGRHHPADILFTSLAEEHGDGAIGVVLSGGDTDGALGIQAIKLGGGITFAQEPASARFPSMPRNAIATGCVDFVLRPTEISRELTRLSRHPYLRSTAGPEGSTDKTTEAPAGAHEEQLRHVFRRLRTAHGVDFSHYKRNTLLRRLARRMALQKTEELADYIALINSDPAEAAALYQDFLIRVTGFFRDPQSFELLTERVFPRLSEGRSSKMPIRIWVPGCASGEEVYSIAITLVEYLGNRIVPGAIQLFGTDVSEVEIEKARSGVYLDSIALEVSSERLQRFFAKQGDHFRIAKSVRELCIFARHDVTRDPPFSRLDLVSCRNLLIYLDASAQRRVMQVFHYALRPHGFLILGPSESVGQAADLFELADKQLRLYTRGPALPGAGVDLAQRGTAPDSRPAEATIGDASILLEADSPQREADRLLLASYAPASLLVDEALNILQFRGETSPYLEHASGPPSLNLQRVVRPELLVEISPAIQEARETGSAARREALRVGDRYEVAIEVIPVKRLSADRCYLIVFDDGSRRQTARWPRQTIASELPESEKDRRLAQAERQIASIRDYLQATMEEHEAVKEELKSAHEEVLSANEEFQSTNEELETAKEELQSANEELTTTNDELRNRNRELGELNSRIEKERESAERARAYADVIVESVRDPLLVLEGDLKVVRANQAFYVDFKARREDTEGHFLYQLGTGEWNTPALRENLHAVLTRSEPMNDREVTLTIPLLGPRLKCLSARKIPAGDERGELILLAIDDITERRAKADTLKETSRRKDEFLAMLAHELRNPLTPITHAIHLLRHTPPGESSTKLYDMVERQTVRLVRLVDELLDMARISRGLIELKRETLDLSTLVRHAADASRVRIEERGHTLALGLPEVELLVDGDPVRLEQVISNLIENAAKYTNPGGQIAVTLARVNSEAVLSVRDNGIGLAPEVLERIFDLFMQVDNSLIRSGGGLGLGLAVVYRILELHHGHIEARSDGLGHGSEFVVRVPALPAVSKMPQSTVGAQTKAAVPAGRARRVLVVDDNEDSAASMALLARSWGYEVTVARDGPSALALAESFAPEIAIVDIGLPGMDGHELARRFREQPRYRDLFLVALTGYGRPGDRNAAQAAGFDAYLVKPAEINALKGLLANGRPSADNH
jgi:two-component system, chemotaxis family, CheB/CheR fusion protein